MGANLLNLLLLSHRVKIFIITPRELANRKIKIVAARIINMVLETEMADFERHLGGWMILRTWKMMMGINLTTKGELGVNVSTTKLRNR